jgi:tetratricopeptide (TPR) repeat protein
MATPIADAMRLLEAARFEEAARAFAPLAGATGDGVIARFRRAECLSRTGLHDEAVAEAARAHADAPEAPATGLWLAQALAEAGRFDDAAAVRHPEAQGDFVSPVARGYAALARIAAGVRDGRDAVVRDVLESRHAPLYSLALRATERVRLGAEPRWPDLPSVWYRHECELEMEEDGVDAHPEPPKFESRGGFLGRWVRHLQSSEAIRWMRLHAACGDWSALLRAVRAADADLDALAEIELEMLLALGRIDAADALAEQLAKGAGDDAAGELAIDRCRIAQLRGRAARPQEFAGYDDARKRLGDGLAWLECGAAILDGRPLDARAAADRVADPSHREYVEAALLRWAQPASA